MMTLMPVNEGSRVRVPRTISSVRPASPPRLGTRPAPPARSPAWPRRFPTPRVPSLRSLPRMFLLSSHRHLPVMFPLSSRRSILVVLPLSRTLLPKQANQQNRPSRPSALVVSLLMVTRERHPNLFSVIHHHVLIR